MFSISFVIVSIISYQVRLHSHVFLILKQFFNLSNLQLNFILFLLKSSCGSFLSSVKRRSGKRLRFEHNTWIIDLKSLMKRCRTVPKHKSNMCIAVWTHCSAIRHSVSKSRLDNRIRIVSFDPIKMVFSIVNWVDHMTPKGWISALIH